MSVSATFPNFVGVGGKKCATTWLAQCLKSHPDVFLSTPKELGFFNSGLNVNDNLNRYLAHFQAAGGQRAVGEFSTSYLYCPATPGQIAGVLGKIRIIVSLRNPIQRFLSDYIQSVLREQLIKVEGAEGIRVSHRALEELRQQLPAIFDHGKYYPGLSEFTRVFGQESVLVLVKEEIEESPERELRRLYRFLNVDPTYEPPMLYKVVSPGIVPRYSPLERMRSGIFHYCRRRAPFVIDWVQKLRLTEVYRRVNADRHIEIELQEEARNALRSFYAEDVQKVQELLGRMIKVWDEDFN